MKKNIQIGFFILFVCCYFLNTVINTANAGVYKCKVNNKMIYSSTPCKNENQQQKINHSSPKLKAKNVSIKRASSLSGVKSNWDCSSKESAIASLPSKYSSSSLLKQFNELDRDSAEFLEGLRVYSNNIEWGFSPSSPKNIRCSFSATRPLKRNGNYYYDLSFKNLDAEPDSNFHHAKEYLRLINAQGFNLKTSRYVVTGHKGHRWSERWVTKNAKCNASLESTISTADKLKKISFRTHCFSREK